MDVFTYSIHYLKEHLLEKIFSSHIGDKVKVTDISFVLTVPAIWDDTAKMFMREAATAVSFIASWIVLLRSMLQVCFKTNHFNGDTMTCLFVYEMRHKVDKAGISLIFRLIFNNWVVFAIQLVSVPQYCNAMRGCNGWISTMNIRMELRVTDNFIERYTVKKYLFKK